MKILPYPDTPILISYHNKAFPFGIIEANSPEDITKWICTKCISCVYNPNSSQNKFDMAIVDSWGCFERLTTQQFFIIKKALIPLANIDLPSMLKVFIDNGCYVHGEYNEKYIPNKWAYGKYDYYHDFLLIGYDEENFYSVGFVDDGKFKRYRIPIDNFIDGLNDTNSSRLKINFFSYNEGAVPKPDVDRMISDLNSYVLSTNPFDEIPTNDKSYGISSLLKIKEFFLDEVLINERNYVDLRYSRVLYEHKWMLVKLLNAFLDEDEREEFINYANQNLNRAESIHMLGLKIKFTKDPNIIYRIAKYIDEIIENEKKYIPKLIKVLKTKREKNLL